MEKNIQSPTKLSNASESINLFKERMNELYKLEETATNEFDKMFTQMMNKNFKKQEKSMIKLLKNGYAKIKQ
jgi:hypothetical protein